MRKEDSAAIPWEKYCYKTPLDFPLKKAYTIFMDTSLRVTVKENEFGIFVGVRKDGVSWGSWVFPTRKDAADFIRKLRRRWK